MSNHKWIVTKENKVKCDCRHAGCQEMVTHSKDWMCTTCGQTTWKTVHDNPDNVAYGIPVIPCDDFIRLVVKSVNNSEHLQSLVKALIR